MSTMTARIAILALVALTPGCLSPTTYEEDRLGLETSLEEVRSQLAASEREREAMAAQLDELAELRAALDAASQARHQLLERLEDLDENRIRPLADGQSEQGQLLRDLNQVRLNEVRGELSDLRARIDGLNQRIGEYQSATSTRAMVELQKEVADLDARVEVQRRLADSNTANIDQLNRSMGDLVDTFNRQMGLLEQYVNQQFMPLAQELVGHLYSESRRMGESAESLEELARKVDPYKFSHLVPRMDDPAPGSSSTSKDDRQ